MTGGDDFSEFNFSFEELQTLMSGKQVTRHKSERGYDDYDVETIYSMKNIENTENKIQNIQITEQKIMKRPLYDDIIADKTTTYNVRVEVEKVEINK